jgi:hypothetical protein
VLTRKEKWIYEKRESIPNNWHQPGSGSTSFGVMWWCSANTNTSTKVKDLLSTATDDN